MSDTAGASGRDPRRLASLVEPGSTAVLTMEMQRGVVGPGGMMPALAEQVAASGTIRVAASVCEAARAAGARVVHCTNQTRPDGAGGAVNCRILGLADRLRREHGIAPTQAGTDGARLVPELGRTPAIWSWPAGTGSRRSRPRRSTRLCGTSASGPSWRRACR